jgi:hypothetical protein
MYSDKGNVTLINNLGFQLPLKEISEDTFLKAAGVL